MNTTITLAEMDQARRVAGLILEAGLTQAAAGALCGVTARTIANWRSGQTKISAEALDRLKQAAAAAHAPDLASEIASLRKVQDRQIRWLATCERASKAAQWELAVTTKRLNALYAARAKEEKPEEIET